ncbi:MAG: T9SS type A sorting domain-containing protein [bacterium]
MRRFLSLIVGTQFIMFSIVNATNVSGIISTNTVWNTTGSPYIVTGNVLVDTLVTLTIQPGVEVKVNEAKYIMVKGILRAIGTSSDSIIITKNGTAGWSRLWLRTASICSLKYCRIEYADSTAIYNDDNGSFYVGYCTISNNPVPSMMPSVYCINNYKGSAVIINSTISNNSGAINTSEGNYGSAIIVGNTITNNSGYYGILSNYSNSGSAIISGNIVSNTSGTGIYNWMGTGKIVGNTIIGNTRGGIYNVCVIDSLTIAGNTISNNGSANDENFGSIYSKSDSLPDFPHLLTIRYNRITDTTYSAIHLKSNFNTLIRTNNIYATGYTFYNNDTLDIDVKYNYLNSLNTDTIDAKIYDYYDDFSKGKVLYQPFLNTPFIDTTAPSAPINLTSTKLAGSKFRINWTNPADSSGIAIYYYKVGSAPTFNFDISGVFYSIPDTLFSTGGELYVWLQDGSGNLNYQNNTSVMLGIEESSELKVKSLELQISKNPFIKSTTIKFSVGNRHVCSLKIYDITGNCVKTLVNEKKDAGNYEASFDTKGLASGIYFAKLSAGNISINKKLILMK